MMRNISQPRNTGSHSIIALVATVADRVDLLHRALRSIAKQSRHPDHLVIVGDNTLVDQSMIQLLHTQCHLPPLHCLINTSDSGAAQTWNAGIEFIVSHWPDCYVAILDDDDEWDVEHLACCAEVAKLNHWPDVIISGLRMHSNNVECPRPPINAACAQDFLAGNPGWQGSNTFIKLSTLIRAGCFTSGLQSCNDRDLAIRVLNLDDVRVTFTGCHTATWHIDIDRVSLSGRRNPQKLAGLSLFYRLHGDTMSTEIRQSFFSRAKALFDWHESDILQYLSRQNNV